MKLLKIHRRTNIIKSNYITANEVDTKILNAGYVTASEVDAKILNADYAKIADINCNTLTPGDGAPIGTCWWVSFPSFLRYASEKTIDGVTYVVTAYPHSPDSTWVLGGSD